METSVDSLSVLIVDDDQDVRAAFERALLREGHRVRVAGTGREGLDALRLEHADVVLLDFFLPDVEGVELLPQLKRIAPAAEVLAVSGSGSMRAAMSMLQAGAYDFLPKPFRIDALLSVLERIQRKKPPSFKEPSPAYGGHPPDLIGTSQAIRVARDFLDKIAPTGSNVLIHGETGTGKEVAARRLHAKSPRAPGPFVAVNCGAFPEGMLESELFGHEKGAFTDASAAKRGLLEAAEGGTLILDEVGDMPVPLQVKLLRAVETRRFRRLGDTRERDVDARILAATHRDLQEAVRRGGFREDLYFRLAVFTVSLPPLRDRAEDIPLLVERFLAEIPHNGKGRLSVSPTAMERLASYSWPGNVRELRNILEHVAVFSSDGEVGPDDLPEHIRERRKAAPPPREGGGDVPLLTLDEMEKNHLKVVLERFNGHRGMAAKALGISERALYYKLKKFGLAG